MKYLAHMGGYQDGSEPRSEGGSGRSVEQQVGAVLRYEG